KWRLPGAQAGEGRLNPITPAEAPSPQPGTPAQASPAKRAAEVTPVPGAPAQTAETETRRAAPMFVPELRRLNVTGGNFRFLDRSGGSVATFESVRFHSSVRNNQTLRGSVNVSKIALRDRFFLQSFQSPLRYDPAELNLSKI